LLLRYPTFDSAHGGVNNLVCPVPDC
jgi:hypothetical protein